MIKVSIIVPVYNVEQYLEKCLDSLVNQTLKEIEIIVVNDGSPDNSQVIVNQYVKQYPKKIKSYQKENGGLSDARNYGLKYATGEFIAFVDSDDWVELDMYESMYQKALTHQTDIVVCDYKAIFSDYHSITTTLYKEGVVDSKEYLMLPVAAWNKIYRKTLLEKSSYQYPKGLWYEDVPTNPILVAYTKQIYYLKQPFYNYLQRDGSIMNQTDFNPKMFDILTSLSLNDEAFRQHDLYNTYYDQLEYYALSRCLATFPVDIIKRHPNNYKQIKRFTNYMKEKYPHWRKNPYYKKMSLREKLYCNLFYYQLTWFYLQIRKLKH